jgi:hypothetical protein
MKRKECVLLSKVSETSFSSPIRRIDPRESKGFLHEGTNWPRKERYVCCYPRFLRPLSLL